MLGASDDGTLPETGIALTDQHRGANALSSGPLSEAMEEEVNARLEVAYAARAKANKTPVGEVRGSDQQIHETIRTRVLWRTRHIQYDLFRPVYICHVRFVLFQHS